MVLISREQAELKKKTNTTYVPPTVTLMTFDTDLILIHDFWETRRGVRAEISFVGRGAPRNISLRDAYFSTPSPSSS